MVIASALVNISVEVALSYILRDLVREINSCCRYANALFVFAFIVSVLAAGLELDDVVVDLDFALACV